MITTASDGCYQAIDFRNNLQVLFTQESFTLTFLTWQYWVHFFQSRLSKSWPQSSPHTHTCNQCYIFQKMNTHKCKTKLWWRMIIKALCCGNITVDFVFCSTVTETEMKKAILKCRAGWYGDMTLWYIIYYTSDYSKIYCQKHFLNARFWPR